MKDELGDRIKEIEGRETGTRFDPTIPVYARIDGRGFSKFTRGMEKPFDRHMSLAMRTMAGELLRHTEALIAYTQSDEVSLVWLPKTVEHDLFFSGKKQKMVSVLASMATALFMKAIMDSPDEHFRSYIGRIPHFDARVFQVDTPEDVSDILLWREQDASRNAISMAAYSVFPEKALRGVKSHQKIEMLGEKGIDFFEYPVEFRRGVFLRREMVEQGLTEEEFARLPEKAKPYAKDKTYQRGVIRELDIPSFHRLENRIGVIFHQEEPRV